MEFPIDILRATEAAAIAASKWIGAGVDKKEDADRCATIAMRNCLNSYIEFAGNVVMGEGEKDRSFGIFPGEAVGIKAHLLQGNPSYYKQLYGGRPPKWHDVAVDPIEGTTQTVISGPEALSTIAVGGKDSMFRTEYFYTNKIVYGQKIREKATLSLKYPLEENIKIAASALGKPPSELMVCVIDRPRHKKIINKLRSLGIRINLLRDCDIVGGIASCLPTSDIDFLYGIGGSPETVLTAAAIKCLGGGMESQVYGKDVLGDPHPIFSTEGESWTPIGDILNENQLVAGPCVFAATGITNGAILNGIKHRAGGIQTNSVFMDSSRKVIRWVINHYREQS